MSPRNLPAPHGRTAQRAITNVMPRALVRWRPAVVAALLALSTAAVPTLAAEAGNPHSSTLIASPLSLVSYTSQLNPNAPPWCAAEDAVIQQSFSGYLAGVYTTSQQLCGLSTDYYDGVWWDAGGIGLESDVYVVGQLTDLAITSPDGTAHHAVLMGQSTSKHVTTYHYGVCYVPPYSLLNDIGGTPLPGGTWGISLSGTVSSATWHVNATMTDVAFQQSYCPPSQQNIVP